MVELAIFPKPYNRKSTQFARIRLHRSNLLLSLVFVFALISGDADAKTADPCTFMGNIETRLESSAGFWSTIDNIYSRVNGFFGEEYLEELSETDKAVRFTNQRGYFFVLDCGNPKEERRIAKAGMFGVGNIFLPKKYRYFTTNGKIKKYLYGLSEYGLYVFIRDDKLTKMTDDEGYVFNNSDTIIQFCTNGRYCSGQSKEFTERHHFATLKADILRTKMQEIETSQGCAKLPVSIYLYNERSGKNEVQFRNADIEYCHRSKWNGIRAYTKKIAESKLKSLYIKGQYFYLLSKPVAQKLPFVVSRINCEKQKVLKKKSAFSLGASLNAGLDFVIKTTLNGKAEINYDIEDAEVFDNETQYLFLTYSIFPHNYNAILPSGVNDLIIEHKCVGRTPDETKEIFLHVDPASATAISLNVSELQQKAREFVPTQWKPSTSGRMRGYTWRIFELRQYEKWRNLMWEFVSNDLTSVLPDDVDGEFRRDLASFYLAVLMASSFEYVEENADQEEPFWR